MWDNGDCTVIITPTNKKILIDGGGNLDLTGFDPGERILLPYLLARGIKTTDYVMISHFDADHCNRIGSYIRKIKSERSNYFKTN